MKLRLIITGGTFDKDYDEIKGVLTFKDSHLKEILENVRCKIPIELENNQLIDSLDMQEENRIKILDSCRNCSEDMIIVTHGTDTMTETAKVLGQANLDKTIVLTGAMIPYTFKNTDAVFNLGCGIIAVQSLKKGVYITMNGRIFSWDNVVKVKDQGIFDVIQ